MKLLCCVSEIGIWFGASLRLNYGSAFRARCASPTAYRRQAAASTKADRQIHFFPAGEGLRDEMQCMHCCRIVGEKSRYEWARGEGGVVPEVL